MVATATGTAPPRTWRFALPRYQRGPKPRRRAEFWLLSWPCGITTALYALASLGQDGRLPLHLWGFLGVIFGLSIGGAPRQPLAGAERDVGVAADRDAPQRHRLRRDRALEPGLRPAAGRRGSRSAPCCTSPRLFFIRRSRDLDRYRYLLLLVAHPPPPRPGDPPRRPRRSTGRGCGSTSARSQFQPVEIAKLLFVIFFASYFATTKELLTIPSRRIGNHLFVDPRPLIPIVVTWLLRHRGARRRERHRLRDAPLHAVPRPAVDVDRTGRLPRRRPRAVRRRRASSRAHRSPRSTSASPVWLNPWPLRNDQRLPAHPGRGTRSPQGGIVGTGVGLGSGDSAVPYLTSDMMFVAIGQEMGLLGLRRGRLRLRLLVGHRPADRPALALRLRAARARSGSRSSSGSRPSSSWRACSGCSPSPASPCRSWPTGGRRSSPTTSLIALLMRLSEEAETRPSRRAPTEAMTALR